MNEVGEVDPGGNKKAGISIDGIAEANLRMTASIFEMLADKGVCTHMISYEYGDDIFPSMNVRRVELFKPGLEWIGRWICTGSFLRRYKSISGLEDGVRITEEKTQNSHSAIDSPIIEITIKDDEAGDPLIYPDFLVHFGVIKTKQLLSNLIFNTKYVMEHLHHIFEEKNLDLWDAKIEWGIDSSSKVEIMLIDEISSASVRAYDKETNIQIKGIDLAKRFFE
jgi:phosphoribosylaminoimidazole-succinocarboxamide synthase